MEAKRYGSVDDKRIQAMKYILIAKGFDGSIESIYDHKGSLNVYWHQEPKRSECESISKIWNDLFSEPCSEHYYKTAVEIYKTS